MRRSSPAAENFSEGFPASKLAHAFHVHLVVNIWNIIPNQSIVFWHPTGHPTEGGVSKARVILSRRQLGGSGSNDEEWDARKGMDGSHPPPISRSVPLLVIRHPSFPSPPVPRFRLHSFQWSPASGARSDRIHLSATCCHSDTLACLISPIFERISRRGLRVPTSTCFLITPKTTVVHLNSGGLRLLRLCHAPTIAMANDFGGAGDVPDF